MMKTGRLSPMEILGGHGIKDTSGLKKMLAKAQEIEDQHIADYKG
jgi:quinone-modifying oxidoreductase subunit QmoC